MRSSNVKDALHVRRGVGSRDRGRIVFKRLLFPIQMLRSISLAGPSSILNII